ncbi:putative ribonuclease H-like domain-containing protein, partial [Tanacetum coccineum]
NQSNSNAGTKACDDVCKARMETVPSKDYIVLPVWPADPLFPQSSKHSSNAGFKPSWEEEKKNAEEPGNEANEVPSTEEPRVNQENDDYINNTNNVNTVSLTVNAASIEVNADGAKSSIEFQIEAIRLFLAYALFKDFVVYQMDVKSAFLYGKIKEEVYICQPPGFEDPDFLDRVYKVEKALYGLHQAPRACLDRKSTTGGCQFLGCRLISWQCNKQIVVANLTTEAHYIAASNCCRHVLWIQNQLLDYGYNFMQTKIHIDNESTICILKNHVFHSKTKHIEIRHHFIRDSFEKKLIQMIKIHTDQNVADLLTKAFDVSRF